MTRWKYFENQSKGFLEWELDRMHREAKKNALLAEAENEIMDVGDRNTQDGVSKILWNTDTLILNQITIEQVSNQMTRSKNPLELSLLIVKQTILSNIVYII